MPHPTPAPQSYPTDGAVINLLFASHGSIEGGNCEDFGERGRIDIIAGSRAPLFLTRPPILRLRLTTSGCRTISTGRVR